MLLLKKIMAYGLLLVLPTLMWGCIGKCKYDLLLSADQHAYFIDFQPGDYWIYRNVQNGDLDSVYFVSQEIHPQPVSPGDPICRQEDVTVQLKGFAKSLNFAYIVHSWDGDMSIDITSAVDYYGSYDINSQKYLVVNGKIYPQTVSTTHCCLTVCKNQCGGTYMRFDRLVFAKSIGIIRWEAIRHPQFGTVTYELIRSNRL